MLFDVYMCLYEAKENAKIVLVNIKQQHNNKIII